MSTGDQNRLAWKVSSMPAAESHAPKKRSYRVRVPDRFLGWIIPLGILLMWEVLARGGMLPANWLPAPTVIAQTIYEMAVAGDLWRHVGITVARVAVGFLIGATAGTLLGALTGYLSVARKLLDPLLQSLRSVPSIAWVPLFLLWLGIQETSKISLISLGAFFPVYLNLSVAMRHVDWNRASRAQPDHLTLLQNTQQFHLYGKRQIPNFIQKQRSAARCLKPSGAGHVCARERSALMAKKLALYQSFGKRSAIYR
ncbi:MAG TPA: ABC transporter permease subunit [Candidatus Eremiobacteraceae bacterium]|nr:ABC transporter permease subunit [Candidatus Eremiobacteraceae bacterium]